MDVQLLTQFILDVCQLITVFHEYLAGIIFSEFVILEISLVFNLAIPKKKKKVLFCCSLAYTPAYTHPAIAKYSEVNGTGVMTSFTVWRFLIFRASCLEALLKNCVFRYSYCSCIVISSHLLVFHVQCSEHSPPPPPM